MTLFFLSVMTGLLGAILIMLHLILGELKTRNSSSPEGK